MILLAPAVQGRKPSHKSTYTVTCTSRHTIVGLADQSRLDQAQSLSPAFYWSRHQGAVTSRMQAKRIELDLRLGLALIRQAEHIVTCISPTFSLELNSFPMVMIIRCVFLNFTYLLLFGVWGWVFGV